MTDAAASTLYVVQIGIKFLSFRLSCSSRFSSCRSFLAACGPSFVARQTLPNPHIRPSKMASTLVIASFLGLTAAQSTTLSLPFYGFGTQAIEASVISANPSATTMAIACPSGTDANDCGLFPYMTLVYGPSTYHLDMGVGDANAFTMTVDCGHGATVTCMESASGSEANFPGSSTTTYGGEDIGTLPVTVTSGAEKLGSTQASATGSASGSASQSGNGSATSRSAASATTASVTQITGTISASESGIVNTGVASASATPSTGAASFNFIYFHGGLVGAVVGLFGMLI